MKQIWSKSLACLLCLALLVGMLPVAALAAQDTHRPETYSGPTELDWQGAGTENAPYLIDTFENLAALRDAVNDGQDQTGQYFKMTANIDLGGEENPWTSIGYGGKSFTGTFDGAGHTISGLYLNFSSIDTYQDQGLGLFTYVRQGGTVKNLTVKGEIDGTNAGVVVGGIAGRNDGGTISNCTSIVDITGSVDSNVGGIVGSGESGTIENCCNTGSINVTGSVDSNVGGIVGLAGNPNGRVTVTVENCENTGNVTVKGNADGTGGIVGGADSGTVSNCRNSGSIDGNESITGGIVGDNYGAIFRCNNTGAVTGAVTGDGATGGIAGRNVSDSNGPGRVENCCNTGDVTGAVSGSGDVGGVVGHNNNSEKYVSKIKNCYNTGKVTGTGNLGGAVGRIETGDVSDC